jgi:hypothetical protein
VKFASRKLVLLAALAALGVLGLASSALASGGTLSWKGQTWDVSSNASAVVTGDDAAVLTRDTGTSDATLHVNRVEPTSGGASFINANGTPWIEYSYEDNGFYRGVDIFIDSERTGDDPRLQAGSLFACQGLGYLRFDPGSQETFGYAEGCDNSATPGTIGSLRAAGQRHTIYVGERADGTIDYNYDGQWFTSTFLKDNTGPFDFNDVYLRLRGPDGASATFTDFRYGADHPSSKADCKRPGGASQGSDVFKSQGDCVSFFASQNRAGGNP